MDGGQQGADAGQRVVWLDASAGTAGDMLLAALVDAGVPLETLQSAVDAAIPGAVRLTARQVSRAGLRAAAVQVALLVGDQPPRTWGSIRSLLESAPLADGVRRRALAAFAALAAAEARVHGVDVEQVHFHEVGAWDCLADVVGVCAGVEALGVSCLVVSPIAVGSGTVTTAHGVLPVPVPAVLELCRAHRLTVTAGGPGELATPTGVALLATLADRCAPLPAMTIERVGVGAGGRDRPDRANVVRLVLGTAAADAEAPGGEPGLEVMALVESTVDDVDPRLWPTILADLLAAGAADAWLTPVLMKKGRPGHVLSVLGTPQVAPALRRVVLERTTALGVRQSVVVREVLDRAWLDVPVPFRVSVTEGGSVAVKIGHRTGLIVHVMPEFEDVLAVAEASGKPAREVLEAAVAAAHVCGLVPGAAVPQGVRASR